MHNSVRRMVVAWAPFGRRSESFAKGLGAELRYIHFLKFQRPVYAPAKYVLQAVRTLQVLFARRPGLVFVQNPPFVCGLVVHIYCRVTGAAFVLDYHSAAFASIWNWALPIQRFLARRAIANTVTNQHWADVVRSWSADALVLGYPLAGFALGEPFPVQAGFNVVFICTFADDEPVEAVLKAAGQLPDVHFYITGDARRAPAHVLASAPPNVVFTGFLSEERYAGLLREAQVLVALTTRDHTLQCGGYEAVSLGKPLITSDWPFLREAFSKGTVHVLNTAEGIRDGVQVARKIHPSLENEMQAFREEIKKEWRAQLDILEEVIAKRCGSPLPRFDSPDTSSPA